MDWLKLNSNGILRGSLANSTETIQLTWIKLLALMSETHLRNGRFEYARNKPYSLKFIASSCGVSKKTLENCLIEYEADVNPETNLPRIQWDNGTLILTNWLNYQAKPLRKKNDPLPLSNSAERAITMKMAEKHPGSAVDGIINASNDGDIKARGLLYRLKQEALKSTD